MAHEVIYTCESLNNKNVRQGELNILEKHENQLCFEFGSDRMNIKKRFYADIETLNKDFDNLLKLKEKEEREEEEEVVEPIEELKNKDNKKTVKQSQKKNEKEKSDTETNKKDIVAEDLNVNEINSKIDKYKIIKRKK